MSNHKPLSPGAIRILMQTPARRALQVAQDAARRAAANPDSLAEVPAGARLPLPGRPQEPTSVPMNVPVPAGHQGQSSGPPRFGSAPELVHEPGGDVARELLTPGFQIIEFQKRSLPEQGMFLPSVSPQSPFQWELGAFVVPRNTAFLLFDYEFAVYRPSGLDPGDSIKAAPGRFTGNMGFDLTLDGRRLSNLMYELDPVAISATRESFADPTAPNAGAFNSAAANSFASTAGIGTSLLPVRPNVQGARGAPFTLIANETTRVALSCVIFRALTSPINFVEGTASGYLLQEATAMALINRLRPR